jgi:hypothetical protein
MISNLLQDLLDKLNSVEALTDKVGFQVGGTENDPTLSEAPIPFGWVVFGGSTPLAPERGATYRITTYEFNLILVVGYGLTDVDFLTNHIQLIEDTAQAVSGTPGNEYTDLWEFGGAELKGVYPNRLVYNLSFSINGHHKTT